MIIVVAGPFHKLPFFRRFLILIELSHVFSPPYPEWTAVTEHLLRSREQVLIAYNDQDEGWPGILEVGEGVNEELSLISENYI